MEKLKVLVVEDMKQIRVIYDVGLHDDIFDKRFAGNGSDALEIYDEWRPDIIILDIMLPGISGYTVLRSIREEKGDKDTTVIMATSLSDKDTVMDCLKVGIQGYLVKPFTHKEIAARILDYFRNVSPQRAEACIARLGGPVG